MTSSPNRARPGISDLTRPFWEAARAGRLAIQKCAQCGYFNHPPRERCDKCLSDDLAFEIVSGRGRIWSFTIMHQKNVLGFEDCVPYLTALVELDEQTNLLLFTNLPGAVTDEIVIGMPVRITFERIDDEITLPQFEIVEGGKAG